VNKVNDTKEFEQHSHDLARGITDLQSTYNLMRWILVSGLDQKSLTQSDDPVEMLVSMCRYSNRHSTTCRYGTSE